MGCKRYDGCIICVLFQISWQLQTQIVKNRILSDSLLGNKLYYATSTLIRCFTVLMFYVPVNNFSIMLSVDYLSSWVEPVLSRLKCFWIYWAVGRYQGRSQAESRKPGLQHHMCIDTRNPDFS